VVDPVSVCAASPGSAPSDAPSSGTAHSGRGSLLLAADLALMTQNILKTTSDSTPTKVIGHFRAGFELIIGRWMDFQAVARDVLWRRRSRAK
jgi:hypothetical protein